MSIKFLKLSIFYKDQREDTPQTLDGASFKLSQSLVAEAAIFIFSQCLYFLTELFLFKYLDGEKLICWVLVNPWNYILRLYPVIV